MRRENLLGLEKMKQIDELLVEHTDDGVVWLTLNRAAKANALTVSMVEALNEAIAEAVSSSQVNAVLLTGSGQRVFCAGVDVREPSPDGDERRQREKRSAAMAALQDAVLDAPKPVVVMLNGVAIGAGAMLALLADACIAAEHACLSLPEIDIGIPTYSGVGIVESIAGRALARDLVQTGRRMNANEALARGVFNQAHPFDRLRDAALDHARMLGAKPQPVFAEVKRWSNRGVRAALEEARAEHARHRASTA